MAEIQVQVELFREIAIKEILHVGGDGFHAPVMQVDACRLTIGVGTDMPTCMHNSGCTLEILVLCRPVGLRADFDERPFKRGVFPLGKCVLLQDDQVAAHLCTGTICKEVVGQADSREQPGPVHQVLPYGCAHNVGGGIPPLLFLLGMAWFNDWHAALYMPAFGAILLAIFAFAMMRDTPQSCGLPPIEEYKNDYPDDYSEKHEEELTAKQIFMQYILPNKLLWYIAIANVFVYLLRYGILDWSPTYLKEVKHFALDKSSWAYFLYEYAGIPGTLLCGWMSDKVFKGNRGATGVFFMTLVTIATVVYWLNPPGNPGVDMACMIIIGFLIYGPVMLIGLHALELAPKKAAGTAAGFTGLFGYLGGSVAASAIVGYTVDFFGWDGGFMVMIGGSVLAVILLVIVMLGERRHHQQLKQA